MKSLYYRSQKISSRALVMLAVLSLLTIVAIELSKKENSVQKRELMTSAAYQAEAAFESLHCRRVEMGHKMLADQDPADTGMLGPSMSLVTTLPGHLDAKQTSVNPNFAAVVVKHLTDVGAQPGDHVAIGCTGSFPALNIAVITAVESMKLRPVLISSAASSQFGANHPELMWPDIERSLFEEGIIRTRSLATSRGGFNDKAAGMTSETKKLIDAALERSGTRVLESDSLQDAIAQRMRLFAEAIGGKEFSRGYVAYINVGGGSASVGGTEGNDIWGSGLIDPEASDRHDKEMDSVAARFLAEGVPLLNMVNVVHLARANAMPVAPTVRPDVGESGVYVDGRYRKSLVIAGILMILFATCAVVKPPEWFTRGLAKAGVVRSSKADPEWMV